MKVQLDMAVPAAAVAAAEPWVRTASPPTAGAAPGFAPVKASPAKDALQLATRQINDYLRQSASAIVFSVDQRSDRVIVRVVDPQTNQVIRQIPSEEVLAIAQSIDQMSGLLLRQTA